MFDLKSVVKFIYFSLKRKDNIIIKSPTLVAINSKISKNIKIGIGTRFSGEIDEYSFVGNNCNFPLTKIGKYCSIANDVHLIAGTHPISKFVSTSPFFYSSRFAPKSKINEIPKFSEFKYTNSNCDYLLEIGSDVWIGQRVSILNGVTLGNGAIVGACSLVTKDVPPFAIVAGVPAKIIGYRFEEQQIVELEKIQWWNRDILWIKSNINRFSDVNEFLSLDCQGDKLEL